MSNDLSTTAAAEPKKQSKLLSIVIGVCAVIAIVGGIAKMTRGLSQIFGGLPAEVEKLLEESDIAAAKAVEAGKAADVKFDALIAAVNAKTLDELRASEKDAVAEAQKGLGETAKHFRLAQQKLEEAAKHDVGDKVMEFLTPKIAMHHAYAEMYDLKSAVVALIVDETITDRDALIDRMNELSAKADAAFKTGNDESAKADAIVKNK